MVMPAQQTQGMSISDIIKLAQLAKQGQQTQPQTGDMPTQTEMTYTRESGSPVQNGVNVPVPQAKPDFTQPAQGGGLWNTLKGYFGG